jgi:hypothetical protein
MMPPTAMPKSQKRRLFWLLIAPMAMNRVMAM